ncbi:manganese efflux pump [Clostridium ganghwense]|uniref:Putative manganese efflux pump MntP n=1 Tax=Clostridium ganghwense TaxID=312089 RepID=A0ABT4CPK1_9CLOT|nr:manganese efflux pump [Clostridium ganghwense]MCY6370962.1 manganese efflux pump [Clostridium ganghwense]
MDLYSLLIIALALALDAFGVALSIGINKGIKFKNKLWFSTSFGFFQFLFAFIGAYAGFLFTTYVLALPKVIGGVIIAVVGALMLKEGLEEKDENILLDKKMYFILGISVSIDAAVVGFTVFNNIANKLLLLKYTLFIGLVSLIMSGFAFVISKYLRKIKVVAKYADYVGGIILILFGLKMIFL